MYKKIVLLSLLCSSLLFSQEINWKAAKEHGQQFVNLHVGLDYGAQMGVSYGYRWGKDTPSVLNTVLALPFGERTFDDFKLKLGGQLELMTFQGFSTSVKAWSNHIILIS